AYEVFHVTGVQTCALPICPPFVGWSARAGRRRGRKTREYRDPFSPGGLCDRACEAGSELRLGVDRPAGPKARGAWTRGVDGLRTEAVRRRGIETLVGRSWSGLSV